MTKQITQRAVVALAAFACFAAGAPSSAKAQVGCCHHATRRSVESKQLVDVRFVNDTNRVQTIYWVDFDGKRRPFKKLLPGQTFEQQSYATHVWVAEASDGTTRSWALDTRPYQDYEVSRRQPPRPVGRPDTVVFQNDTGKTFYIKMLSPGGEVSYEKVPPFATREVQVHTGWTAESLHAGRSLKLKLPEISDGMVFTASGGRLNQLRLRWEWNESREPVPPAPQVPQPLDKALGIEVRNLGGGRMLVLDAGREAGSQLLSDGDIIASIAMVGMPVMPGRPSQPGGILTQMEILPAAGGPVRTVNVREMLGDVLIDG